MQYGKRRTEEVYHQGQLQRIKRTQEESKSIQDEKQALSEMLAGLALIKSHQTERLVIQVFAPKGVLQRIVVEHDIPDNPIVKK